MRILPASLLLLGFACAQPAPAGAAPPPSAANLVRVHPGPWRLPSAARLNGLRSDPPEPGDGTAGALRAFPLRDPELRARAEANVRIAADGSRSVVLGGALRSWTVASIDAAGRLVTDCVHGNDAARQRAETAPHTSEVKR